MSDFVKVCPKCGHASAEYENVCAACDHFIGMEAAVPRPIEPQTAPESEQRSDEAPSRAATATQRLQSGPESFYLEHLSSGRLLTVKSGWTLGQAHDANDAEVQVPLDLAGSDFVHRRHCRFDCIDGRWQVTAINQAQFDQSFTNPTSINQTQVKPDTSHPLNDGDVIRLSDLSLSVRLIR